MFDNTVKYTRLYEWFDGRVFIDELKIFQDDRGFLCELWRTDDTQFNSDYSLGQKEDKKQSLNGSGHNGPEMCYYSHTLPLTMRGPHEHIDQTDWFMTFNSEMVYMFVNEKQETKYFITDPNKIYRIKVEPGVIHSYRNLSFDKIAMTANFPSSLFMGVNKTGEIDEIRHEPKIENNQTVYILGANGRLGKAITNELFNNMGLHSYDVVPVYQKINSVEDLNNLFRLVVDQKKNDNDIIINCIAKTNVQDNSDTFDFSNKTIPVELSKFAIEHGFYILHFSSDYVYQHGDVSPYTKSKKDFEDWLSHAMNNSVQFGCMPERISRFVKVVRLANLFSMEEDDRHNMINKFYDACTSGDPVYIPDGLVVMPTDVQEVAKFLRCNYLFSHDIDRTQQFINVSGKNIDIKELLFDHFGFGPELDCKQIPIDELTVVNNPHVFLGNKNYVELDCSQSIMDKIRQVKE